MTLKTLIINSKLPILDGITHIPLRVAYMAAVLRLNHFPVKTIDLAIEEKSDEQLMKEINKRQPRLIVIDSETTVLETKNFCCAIETAKKIKALFPEIKIVMTGAHVTFRDIETLKRHKEISYIIRYEPDYVLTNLVKALDNKKKLFQVKGITYRRGSHIIRNPEEPPIMNLDKLPFPARDLLPIKKYLEKDSETIVQGSRGCTNRCYFCQSSAMDRTIRFRSIQNIIKEIQQVLALGFESIFFSDNDFGILEERVIQFCKELLRKKIKFKWACNMRADRIKDTLSCNKKLVLMKKSGCYRVFMGFETISNNILKNINKGINVNNLLTAANLLKKHKIALHASFLFGLPGDTEEKIKATVNFAKKLNPEIATFNLLTPYPGTPIGDFPEKFGIVVPDKFWYEKKEIFEKQIHITGNKHLSPKKIQELGNWAYRSFLSS